MVEKAFAKRLPWAGWTYSFAKQRKVYGMHVVVLLWCSTDGTWRIPVAFRLWRPKRTCAPHPYQTKLQLAAGMLTEVVAARLPFQYLVMTPTTPPAGSPAWLAGCSSPGGDARPRTTVVWRGRRQQVATLARQLRLGWRPRLGLRAAAVRVYTPTHGMVGLVVTRNRHGNYDYLVTSDPAADLATVVVRKQSRWQVETIFRDTKQYAGLGACQCWSDQAMVRHAITRQGEQPPAPLKASPAHLRATA